MFDRKEYRIQEASNTIDNLSLNNLKSSYIPNYFSRDYGSSLYYRIQGLEGGNKFCKISTNKSGDFQTEFVNNSNEVDLSLLREFCHDQSGLASSMIYSMEPIHNSDVGIWKFRKEEERKAEQFQSATFSIPDRYEIPPQVFVSGPSLCQQRTITYQKIIYKNQEGTFPQPSFDSLKTYIAKGEYYVLYGGMIPFTAVPQKTIDELLERLEKTNEYHNIPRNELRQKFDNCFYLSDAVWKYHIVQAKWELALPDTNHYKLPWQKQFSRPKGKYMKAFHHCVAKKIYYLCKNFDSTWGPLYEYDYQMNRFRCIDLGSILTGNTYIPQGVIDFSNDTLLLAVVTHPADQWSILVVCLHTDQSTLIKLKQSSNIYLFFSGIGLADNFEKLVLVDNCLEKWCRKITYVDWGKVKRKTLKPFLDKHRKGNGSK